MKELDTIIAKQKNEIVDLKNHIQKQNKKISRLHASIQTIDKEMKEFSLRQKKSMNSFESRHKKCIDNIIKIVGCSNFSTLPKSVRVKAIESEYKKIIIG